MFLSKKRFLAGAHQHVSIPTLTVSATNVSKTEEGMSPSGQVPDTGSEFTTTTPSGGVSPYTFIWTKLTDADGPDFAITNSTAQSPGWSGLRTSTFGDDTETWRVQCTDSDGPPSVAFDTISVFLRWNNTS